MSLKKITLILVSVLTGLFLTYQIYSLSTLINADADENYEIISPLSKIKDKLNPQPNPFKENITNILLIGTDTSQNRRLRGQTGFNTDTMILISINPQTNKVLLTSVPRDLWINGEKMNALYITRGEKELIDAFEKITGQKIYGTIRADFDNFKWVVDAFGGVPVNVQRSFTDYSFPNNNDTGAQTVSFTQGEEIMAGQRALAFARSRKGTNGEGSDLMRAKRQHLLLKGMLEAVKQPKSIFWPMDIEKAYNLLTAPQKMQTTLSLKDAKFLWDFYKDKDKYVIESFVVDGEYIYHPGMYPQSSYRAWVFVPKDSNFSKLHIDIKNKLNNTFAGEANLIAKPSQKATAGATTSK